MSLVYLITGLPRIERGKAPPITRAELVRRCRDGLTGPDREEFELLLRVESVEETVRLEMSARLREASAEETIAAIVQDRRDGRPLDTLPEWLLRPAPQHVLLRRHYYDVTLRAKTDFLRGWANFRVDIGEVVTAVLCRVEGLSRDAFLEQMQGSFDASAPLIIKHWDDPLLGIGQRFGWLPTVVAALGDDDLLAMSRTLDDVAWRKIEALRPVETFCVENLMATYLLLGIVEREASWDAERGAAMLDRILSLSQAAGAPALATTETVNA
jgi:hypothetical protein